MFETDLKSVRLFLHLSKRFSTREAFSYDSWIFKPRRHAKNTRNCTQISFEYGENVIQLNSAEYEPLKIIVFH